MADFAAAIAIDSECWKAFASRGDLLELLREYDRAIRDFDKAIQLNPKSFWSYLDRGGCWKAKGSVC